MKTLLPAVLAIGATLTSHAAVFSESFDTDTSANWAVNSGPGNNAAFFAYDYSQVGIPSAPNSAGSTTLGLKLQANTSGGIFGGISVSPIGQSFSGDYTLRFDLWQNFNGPLGPVNPGGSGSTQISGGGIGTAGASAQWPGGSQDSLWFATSGDGGSSVDYRAYSPAAGTGYAPASGVFAAGTHTSARNESDPYYAGFGGEAAPAAQLALYPGQTGTTAAGAQGFAWRDVVITKNGTIITYTIDGVLIATVDIDGVTLGGDNILLMQSDINATSSADPLAGDLLFGLIDNVMVTPVPEPSTFAALTALGLAFFAVYRRFRAPAAV